MKLPTSFIRRLSIVATTAAALALAACATTGGGGSLNLPNGNAPTEVRMTYFGISNWTFQIGALNIMMDGYMTRIPQDYFFGGGGGLKETKAAWPIDKAAVDKINTTLAAAPGQTINLILTGHSHFDHSFDTPYWAKLTGAPVIGSQSTCYQVQAQGVPASQCTVINGGETIKLNEFVTMRVVLWNHSGTHATNPEQHDPVELTAIPKPDAKGNLRGGVAEDFPNGGGNRGFLFTVKTASGKPLNFFVTNSGGAADLDADTLVNGTINRGSPLNSLRKQVADAGLSSVDLWIGAGGTPVAALTVPIVHPKVVMPNHLGNFFFPFASGLVPQFSDPALVDYLTQQKIALVKPTQYLDAFVLDANGVRPVENAAMKAKYGF
jgi:L-ascorbate metabolism protein UlaG (beta-lactamase superfamily)